MAEVGTGKRPVKTGLWTKQQFVWPMQDAKQLLADIMSRKLWELVSEQPVRFGIKVGQLIELPTEAWLNQAGQHKLDTHFSQRNTYDDMQSWQQTFLLWYLDHEDCPVGEYCVLPISIPVQTKTYRIAVLKPETYARLYSNTELDDQVRPVEPDMETRTFERRRVHLDYEIYDLWQRME